MGLPTAWFSLWKRTEKIREVLGKADKDWQFPGREENVVCLSEKL